MSPDSTLTVENVADVMEKVTVDKRRQVWEAVLTPPHTRRVVYDYQADIEFYAEDIYSSHSTEKEKTHACSDTYVNNHPESSWEHLTSLLYEENEMTAVDQARPFLPPRGKWINFVDYISIRSDRTIQVKDFETGDGGSGIGSRMARMAMVATVTPRFGQTKLHPLNN